MTALIGFAVLDCDGCGKRYERYTLPSQTPTTMCYTCRTGTAPVRAVVSTTGDGRRFSAWSEKRTKARERVEAILSEAGQKPLPPSWRGESAGGTPADWAREGRRRDKINLLLADLLDGGMPSSEVPALWDALIGSAPTRWPDVVRNMRGAHDSDDRFTRRGPNAPRRGR